MLRTIPVVSAVAALSLTLLASSTSAVVPTRNMQLLAHFDEWPGPPDGFNYSACWSYVHPDGREYAVLGVSTGTAIYNVTRPDSAYRVAFIPGPGPCVWREMKSYRNWIYVSSECQGTNDGVQIIRMIDPENPVLVGTYKTNFTTAHTVSVDTTRALLILNGTRRPIISGGLEATGMRILSLAIPEAPLEVSWWPGGSIPVSTLNYVHDSFPIGNRLYTSSIYLGHERILDFTNPAAPSVLVDWTYPGAFTHNSWPDPAGTTLFVTDEVNGEPLKIFDISSLTSPSLVGTWTDNPQAIVHNARMLGNELYLANYTEGVRILDASDPWHPAEFAWADSWPGASGGYYGVWDVCPYFPSGTVIASDIQTGLYVYRPLRNYGILEAQVVEEGSGTPIAGAKVRLTGTGDSATTRDDGLVRFAPDPGVTEVQATAFGFDPVSASPDVPLGGTVPVVLSLPRKPVVDFTGVVRRTSDGAGLGDADVVLTDTPVRGRSDSTGAYLLGSVPSDEYDVHVGRPGYVPLSYERQVAPPSASQDFSLSSAATWDALESPSGWTVGAPGDNATGGIWVRVAPLGTGYEPAARPSLATAGRDTGIAPSSRGSGCGCSIESCAMGAPCGCGCAVGGPDGGEAAGITSSQVAPGEDRTPDPGSLCFVTGQGMDPNNLGEADVDNGKTSLTSPRLDLTGLAQPAIGFWRWFYSTGADPNDWLAVFLSNNDGVSWVPVDTLRGLHNHWNEVTIRVTDFLPATSQMRVRFVAADLGSGGIVEGGIDDLMTYDAAAPVSSPPPTQNGRIAFRAPQPNPSSGSTLLTLSLPKALPLEVVIVDSRGGLVRRLFRGRAPAGELPIVWEGVDSDGRPVAAGLYFALARGEGLHAATRMVRVH